MYRILPFVDMILEMNVKFLLILAVALILGYTISVNRYQQKLQQKLGCQGA